MRPPHYAGENLVGGVQWLDDVPASMRPPHYAGENGLADARIDVEGMLQ